MEHKTTEELRDLIIEKAKIALSAITERSPADSDKMAAEAVNILTSALVNLDCLEQGEDVIAPSGFVADEWYRENFKGE